MIWYSANSIPIDNYRNTSLPRANANEVAYEVLPIDEHLVWSEDHKKYLALGVSIGTIIRVCGSLMFYLPKKPLKTNKIFDLLVFDVTPYADIKGPDFNKIPDSQNSINNSISAKKFLTDILWVASKIEEDFGLKLRVSLKPKRKYTSLHNKDYLDFIRLLLQNQLIEVLEPEIDLYKSIGQSRVCISYPFTSPAIIAKELSIPSIFYMDQQIMNENNHVHGVEFISEKLKLFNFIVKHNLGSQQ
jgi:polysaccharide biosynthesis PFTS motif protein